MKTLILITVYIFAGLLFNCSQSISPSVPTVTSYSPSPSVVPTPLQPKADAIIACNHLHELKQLPYNHGDVVDDPIYNQLAAQPDLAVPCLIERLTDVTRMQDPSSSPSVTDFRVGDCAMFTLLMLTKEEWQPETMLSEKYARLWKTEGIYAYFAYVENPANRKKIQQWWKDWMKENLNK
jgi:hypothetical protein